MRTRTGLVESLLEEAQHIELVARNRLAAPSDARPSESEQRIVAQILRQSVGIQRLCRKWIRVRAEHERHASLTV